MFYTIEYYFSKVIKKLHLRAIKNSKIHNTSKVHAGSHLVNVCLGKYSDIGYDCTIINTYIGSFSSLGANIRIGGASHTLNWVSTSPVFNGNKDSLKKKFSKHHFNLFVETRIGNDVWIGDGAFIKSGINIGDGAVIGMGSVVTRNVQPYEIWAGNPAKFIRKRFDDEIIYKLLNIKWWEWSDEQIEKNGMYFNNVNTFVSKFNLDLK